MSFRIRKSGLLDTLQDDGRYGYQHLGINPGGAMDILAMKIANALVGNDAGEPVLEMHFPAAEIVFETMVLIALSGADFSATVNGDPVPILHPIIIQQGSVLQFGKNTTGARIYLAVAGGYTTSEWLNSSSTHKQVKAGGFEGRALQKNDILSLKKNKTNQVLSMDKPFVVFPWRAKVSDLYVANPFRFIPGAEYFCLTETSKQQLKSGVFTIDQQSDRMGYRLRWEGIALESCQELISSAVTKGTIQLLPDGQLIILMADHQTTGGYPRVGHVISADFASLGQLRAGEKFSLQKTDIPTAENLLFEQQRNLQQLQNACNFRLEEYLKSFQ